MGPSAGPLWSQIFSKLSGRPLQNAWRAPRHRLLKVWYTSQLLVCEHVHRGIGNQAPQVEYPTTAGGIPSCEQIQTDMQWLRGSCSI